MWRFVPKKELTKIYVSLALRSLGLSLISLFIPLYLYVEMGYSLSDTLMFFVFYSLVFAIGTPVAAKFASKYGVKHTVLFSFPFYLIFVLMLYSLPYYKLPLIILGSFVGFSMGFYWIGMHLLFFHASDKKHRGEECGKQRAAAIVGGLIGPLFGGIMISYFGFPIVFILATILLLSSGVMLLLSDDILSSYHFSIRSIVNKDHWKNSLFFVSRGTQVMTANVIWPVFIFAILDSYFSLGIIGTIVSGFSAVVVWLAGKYSDHTDKRKMIRRIVGFESLSWFLRAMVTSVTHIFGATIFGAITSGAWSSPVAALEYDKANKGDITGYFVSREVFLCLGRILVLLVVLMTDSLMGGLIFQGFASFGMLLF